MFPLTSFDKPATITFATFFTLLAFPRILEVSALTITLLKPLTIFLLEFNKSWDLPNTAFCSPLFSVFDNPATIDCIVPTFTVLLLPATNTSSTRLILCDLPDIALLLASTIMLLCPLVIVFSVLNTSCVWPNIALLTPVLSLFVWPATILCFELFNVWSSPEIKAAFADVIDNPFPDIILFSVVADVIDSPINALFVPDVSDNVSPTTITFSELFIWLFIPPIIDAFEPVIWLLLPVIKLFSVVPDVIDWPIKALLTPDVSLTVLPEINDWFVFDMLWFKPEANTFSDDDKVIDSPPIILFFPLVIFIDFPIIKLSSVDTVELLLPDTMVFIELFTVFVEPLAITLPQLDISWTVPKTALLSPL